MAPSVVKLINSLITTFAHFLQILAGLAATGLVLGGPNGQDLGHHHLQGKFLMIVGTSVEHCMKNILFFGGGLLMAAGEELKPGKETRKFRVFCQVPTKRVIIKRIIA